MPASQKRLGGVVYFYQARALASVHPCHYDRVGSRLKRRQKDCITTRRVGEPERADFGEGTAQRSTATPVVILVNASTAAEQFQLWIRNRVGYTESSQRGSHGADHDSSRRVTSDNESDIWNVRTATHVGAN